MEAFKTFDLAYIMTSQPTTELISIRLYKMAFQEWQTGPVLRARLHRADHGAGHHQHLRQVPQQGEGALRWPPSARRAETRAATASPSPRCSSITLIFLAPIYWIASTAFKPRNLATTVPPTVVFTAGDHAVRQALHQARRSCAGRRRRRSTPPRPGGSSWSSTAARRVSRDGKGDVAALGLSQPLHELADRRDHLDRARGRRWARSPPTASRASR